MALWIYLVLGMALVSSAAACDFTGDLDRDGVIEELNLVRSVDGELCLTALGREVIPLTISGVPTTLADLTGDGYLELANAVEILCDGRTLAAWIARSDRAYGEVWNSGADLRNVWDAEIDDLDGDGRCEIIGQSYHYGGTLPHVYECIGDNSFTQLWHADTLWVQSLNAVCTGDTDGDGQREIIAGDCGTLARVFMWESIGDDAFAASQLNFTQGSYDGVIKDVLTGDTDRDSAQEILVATGSSTDGSAVGIYEHTGGPGVNTYTARYVYETVSYLFGIETGDSDNDGNEEIVLNVGGFTGYPMYVRRLEYNPALGGYEHKQTEPGPLGLPLSTAIADLDGDGENELIMGGAIPTGGMVHIFHAHADDAFTLLWTTDFNINGNVIDLCVGPTNMYGYPTIISASFEGQIDVIGYNGETFVRHTELGAPLYVGHPPRSIQSAFVDEGDLLTDLVAGLSGADQVRMYEGADMAGIAGEITARARGPRLWIAGANPSSAPVTIGCAANGRAALTVHDIGGRVVRRLHPGVSTGGMRWAGWDGRDERGRLVPAGAYYCRLATAAGISTAPVMRVR